MNYLLPIQSPDHDQDLLLHTSQNQIHGSNVLGWLINID